MWTSALTDLVHCTGTLAAGGGPLNALEDLAQWLETPPDPLNRTNPPRIDQHPIAKEPNRLNRVLAERNMHCHDANLEFLRTKYNPSSLISIIAVELLEQAQQSLNAGE